MTEIELKSKVRATPSPRYFRKERENEIRTIYRRFDSKNPECRSDQMIVGSDESLQLVAELRDPFRQRQSQTPYSNFLQGVQWCPDGGSLLTASADQTFRVFDTEGIESQTDEHAAAASRCASIRQGELVFDYSWYPYADRRNLQTYCFLSTARAHPVHLWDVCSATVRATYRCYNAQDEIMTCTSVGFTADAQHVFCGAKNSIYVFDIGRPGREYLFVATYSKSEGGIKGLISTIAFSKADPGIYAVGSYNGSIGIFSTDTHDLLLPLKGHAGGVTKVMFSGDGYYLFSGARCDPNLICWDIRATCAPVLKLQRATRSTTQRIFFDLDPTTGRYLLTGGEDGELVVFDLTTGDTAMRVGVTADTLNGVAFHPTDALIATSSGNVESAVSIDGRAIGRRHFSKLDGDSLTEVDASLRLYRFSRTDDA